MVIISLLLNNKKGYKILKMKKRNFIAKDLFSKNLVKKKLNPKKEKEVLKEKKTKVSLQFVE